MQIICISKGTMSGGKQLAERLAEKMGFACLSREELINAATEQGIRVGKLEMAMVKPGIFNEKLSLERDHYLAFSTLYLCQKAMKGGLVYHGRTGHLLFQGVRHILRVRVLADEEYRITEAMQRLQLDRKKAQKYIKEVDEDRRRWVHTMYGISWDDAASYDVVINLAQMNVENAASALVNFAQLPDFKIPPAAKKTLEDLLLGARVRVIIARDDKTRNARVKVRSDNGRVTVTCLPQDVTLTETILEVIQKQLPDLKDIRTTIAMTNVLWVQEKFQPHTEVYNQIVDIATKWNAAVELVRLAPEEENFHEQQYVEREPVKQTLNGDFNEYNGGIEEDTIEPENDNGGLRITLDELSRVGKSGGGRVVFGGQRELVNSLDRNISYTLVVIGDVFLSKGHATKLREARDLRSYLSDAIRAPVVTSDELGSQYLFGKKDMVRMGVYLTLTVLFYILVFTNQQPILAFLAHSGWYAEAVKDSFLSVYSWLPKLVVSIVVFAFVPVVAYCYGKVTSALLKLIKME
ncbi:MAG: cytidylate kinase-like family protein [Thermodesulfobacteriota bacterium]|nr:cytidylate kinase-like family protein [Thermodesulfobacteriota bacterium]